MSSAAQPLLERSMTTRCSLQVLRWELQSFECIWMAISTPNLSGACAMWHLNGDQHPESFWQVLAVTAVIAEVIFLARSRGRRFLHLVHVRFVDQ